MCLSNKATLFQTKGGISDGALRVTYYDSRGIVSCYFIFHVADPTYMLGLNLVPTFTSSLSLLRGLLSGLLHGFYLGFY